MRRIALAALLLACAALAVAWQAGSDARATGSPVAADDALHERGRAIYNYRCYFCHGYSGDAQTVATSALATRPRDFTAARPQEMTVARIARAVREGLAGTAMTPFAKILSADDIGAVSAFVHREFVRDKARNTQYHTAANGWPNHARYRAAFPFATGALPPGTPDSELSAEQRLGRQLFLTACVTCHDRPDAIDEQRAFALRSVSFPEGNYTHAHEAAAHGADPGDPYERHEQAPALAAREARVARGETLFQRSCAYCHAADGSGRNWIGAFLDPPPPDFRRSEVAARFTQAYLRNVTRDGVAGTSMPAWRQVLSVEEIDAVVAYMLRAFGAAGPRAVAR